MAGMAPNFAEWQNSAESRPHSAEIGRNPPNIGRHRAKLGRRRAEIYRIWPKSFRHRLNSAQLSPTLDRLRASSGRLRPIWDGLGIDSLSTAPGPTSNLRKGGHILGRVDQSWSGSSWAKISPSRAICGPKSGQLWPMLDQTHYRGWAGVDRTWAEIGPVPADVGWSLANVGPESAKIGLDSTDFGRRSSICGATSTEFGKAQWRNEISSGTLRHFFAAAASEVATGASRLTERKDNTSQSLRRRATHTRSHPEHLLRKTTDVRALDLEG